jgi:hypothetical protein
MGRKKTGQAHGRKSDFTGEKQQWLSGFCDALRDAGDDPGSVYTDATNAFILQYGYDLPFGDNVDGDPAANPPVISTNPDTEEKERRNTIQTQLRAVSFWLVCAHLNWADISCHRS